ncbi:MAG: iron-sulfur cluster assembly protein [Anaerolineales bacterium]
MIENKIGRLEQLIIARLRLVIDPETQADVIRMRLIENLTVNEKGYVKYTFRPSSPVCPIAVSLAQQIKIAVSQVPGVHKQEIKVENYVGAEQLTILINR